MNPPHFHLLVLPLATLRPKAALVSWALLNLACLLLAIRLVSAELGIRWTPTGTLWALLPATVNAATGTLVVTGQLTFLLLLGVTMAWRSARRNHLPQAGVWLGILASVKPFLGVFLVFFAARRAWKVVAWMAVTVAATVIGGLLIFGTTAYRRWLEVLSSVNWTWPPMNGSIAGVVSRSLSPSPLFTPLLNAPRLVAPETAILTLAILILAVLFFLRHRAAVSVDRAFLVLLLTAQLVTPLGWVYYLWLPLGPAVACWRAGRWSVMEWLIGLVVAVGLACPLLVTASLPAAKWASVTLGSAYFWATLGLWTLAIMPNGPFSGSALATSNTPPTAATDRA